MDQLGAQADVAAEQEPDINPVFDLCADDMSAVNSLIRDSLDSNVILIRQIAEYMPALRAPPANDDDREDLHSQVDNHTHFAAS